MPQDKNIGDWQLRIGDSCVTARDTRFGIDVWAHKIDGVWSYTFQFPPNDYRSRTIQTIEQCKLMMATATTGLVFVQIETDLIDNYVKEQ